MQFPIPTILKTKDINTWINYCFVAFAFSIPLSKAATSLFEGLILLLWILQGNWKYKFSEYIKNPIIVTLFLFLLYSTISLFWASDLLFGLDYVLKYKHFLIIPILYTSLDKKYIEPILSAFLLSMFISEIVSYGIFFEIWKYKNVLPTLPTPFMDHVAYSVYLSSAAMILLVKIFFEKNTKYKIFYLLFFLSVTANLFVNGGRTGQLGFIIMLFTFLIFNMRQKLKAFLISILIIATVLTLAFTFSPNFQARMHQAKVDISTMLVEKDFNKSLSIRIGLWIIGIEQITQELDFGTGIGNDMNQVAILAQKNGMNNNFDSCADHHNMFITYAIQLGELGLLLIVLLFYFVFKIPIQNRMYKNINVLFMIMFTIWGLIGIAFHTMNPMILFSLLVGLANGISFQEKLNRN